MNLLLWILIIGGAWLAIITVAVIWLANARDAGQDWDQKASDYYRDEADW